LHDFDLAFGDLDTSFCALALSRSPPVGLAIPVGLTTPIGIAWPVGFSRPISLAHPVRITTTVCLASSITLRRAVGLTRTLHAIDQSRYSARSLGSTLRMEFACCKREKSDQRFAVGCGLADAIGFLVADSLKIEFAHVLRSLDKIGGVMPPGLYKPFDCVAVDNELPSGNFAFTVGALAFASSVALAPAFTLASAFALMLPALLKFAHVFLSQSNQVPRLFLAAHLL